MTGFARQAPRRFELAHEPARRQTDPAEFCAESDEHTPARLPTAAAGISFARGRTAAVRRASAAYARRLGLTDSGRTTW